MAGAPQARAEVTSRGQPQQSAGGKPGSPVDPDATPGQDTADGGVGEQRGQRSADPGHELRDDLHRDLCHDLRDDLHRDLRHDLREDLQWMGEALKEARLAAERQEVPVGAVLLVGGVEVARGHNRTITDRDPSAHAEIVALRAAAARIGDHRVGGTMVVTLEPCVMCMGAMVQARVERLVFAARDPKAGAAVSLYTLGSDARLNHRFAVHEGPLAAESAELLRSFFRDRRAC